MPAVSLSPPPSPTLSTNPTRGTVCRPKTPRSTCDSTKWNPVAETNLQASGRGGLAAPHAFMVINMAALIITIIESGKQLAALIIGIIECG